jgi:hypothetical protein
MTIAANRRLAERARGLADQAPHGSVDRPAALCAAVVLGTTTTASAARQALSLIDRADIRRRAREILAQLLSEGK